MNDGMSRPLQTLAQRRFTIEEYHERSLRGAEPPYRRHAGFSGSVAGNRPRRILVVSESAVNRPAAGGFGLEVSLLESCIQGLVAVTRGSLLLESPAVSRSHETILGRDVRSSGGLVRRRAEREASGAVARAGGGLRPR
jgi:hypothetical protein